MKKLMPGSLVLLLFPLMGIGQSAFNGTWKLDLSNSHLPEKPDVVLLQNGNYQCTTCVPPINVKADGQDHKITGDPYYDTVNVKVVDDHHIEITDKKNGKVALMVKEAVSADDNTVDFETIDNRFANGQSVTGKGHATRLSKGPVGAHAISGTWRLSKMDNVSDNGLEFTYKVEGDSLSMTSPTGESFTAKLDGTDAPYKGDPGVTSVSVKRLGDNTIEETDKLNGKPIWTAKMTVNPDGTMMTIASNHLVQGTTSQYTAKKQ